MMSSCVASPKSRGIDFLMRKLSKSLWAAVPARRRGTKTRRGNGGVKRVTSLWSKRPQRTDNKYNSSRRRNAGRARAVATSALCRSRPRPTDLEYNQYARKPARATIFGSTLTEVILCFRCSICGELHDEIPHLGSDRPDPWWAVPEDERDRRIQLTSDTCIIDGKEFFIRGVIEIPVHEHADPFGFGVWVSQKKENFLRT